MFAGTFRVKPTTKSSGMPKFCTFRLLSRQSLFGSLTDKVALYLSRQPESEGKDFALDVIAQTVVVFDSPDAALLCHADIQNLHNHKEIPAETGQLTTDNDVILVDFTQQPSKLPFGIILRATDSFLYPVVNDDVLLLTELVNLEALVLNRLLVTAYSDVTINHMKSIFLNLCP
jgi:hypothetical protein